MLELWFMNECKEKLKKFLEKKKPSQVFYVTSFRDSNDYQTHSTLLEHLELYYL